MKSRVSLASLALSILVSGLSTLPVSAQPRRNPCPDPVQEQPSVTTREITNSKHGLRFQVPDNYSALLERSGDRLTIVLRNPADVRFLDCARQNRAIGAGHQVSDVRISVYPIPAGVLTPNDVVRQSSGRTGIQVRSFATMIAEHDAVIYETQSSYPILSRTALLTHPDGLNFVEIKISDYGTSLQSSDETVFDKVVATLELDSTQAAIRATPLTNSAIVSP